MHIPVSLQGRRARRLVAGTASAVLAATLCLSVSGAFAATTGTSSHISKPGHGHSSPPGHISNPGHGHVSKPGHISKPGH